ncbi:MAG: hypothetical protein J7521_11795 [Caulobacter sp.]|nr:hypothetical protein [Caulobacter sp.]
MRTFKLAAIAAGLALLGLPGSGSAHHSFAMYDQAHPLVLRGEIQGVQWTNPHVVVRFLGAKASGGEVQPWVLELTSPGNLNRIGWSRQSLKPGDKVELEISPLRDGQRGGALKRATLLDTGQTLTANWLKPGG